MVFLTFRILVYSREIQILFIIYFIYFWYHGTLMLGINSGGHMPLDLAYQMNLTDEQINKIHWSNASNDQSIT